MMGLDGLRDGAHSLAHPDGPLFVLVRRRRLVHAQLWSWRHPPAFWTAHTPGTRAEQIVDGLTALAEKVVTPAG